MSKEKKNKVLVIGDTIIDKYLFGSVNRQSPENLTVSVLDVEKENYQLGGAANVASNIQSLTYMRRDFDVYYSSVFSEFTGKLLLNANVKADASCLNVWGTTKHEPHKNELIKTRVINSKNGKQLLRIDNRKEYRNIDIANYKKTFHTDLSSFDAIVVSDYCKGLIDKQIIDKLKEYKGKLFIDTKKHDLSIWPQSNTFIKINSKEYAKTTNRDNVKYLIVTSGQLGAKLICGKEEIEFETKFVEFPDVCGAGDVFLAGLVVDFMRNNDLHSAVKYANNVATKSVEQRYTSKVFIYD